MKCEDSSVVVSFVDVISQYFELFSGAENTVDFLELSTHSSLRKRRYESHIVTAFNIQFSTQKQSVPHCFRANAVLNAFFCYSL